MVYGLIYECNLSENRLDNIKLIKSDIGAHYQSNGE